MSKVEEYSNWGYWDSLDGIIIKDGEHLIVTYPDGGEQQVTAIVLDEGCQIHDMGHEYRGANCKAFAEFEWHGAMVKLHLRGMEARRV
jgi:hypothetical protein